MALILDDSCGSLASAPKVKLSQTSHVWFGRVRLCHRDKQQHCRAREEHARLLIHRAGGPLMRDGAGVSRCSQTAELAPGWLWNGLYRRLNPFQISLYTVGCYQCSDGAQFDNRHLQLYSTDAWPACVSNTRHGTKQRHRKHKNPLQNTNVCFNERGNRQQQDSSSSGQKIAFQAGW